MSDADGVRVFVNAAGSNSGGGRTWVLGFLRELAKSGGRGMRWDVLVRSDLAEAIEDRPSPSVHVTRLAIFSAPARIAWEQLVLPVHPAVRAADVLLSAANFTPLGCRRPNVLLARNALHFDDFRVERMQPRLKVETALARASVRRATTTVVASEAMAARVQTYTGCRAEVIPFGPGLVTGRGATGEEKFVFVHRTFWGPHKRFAELLAAIRVLAETEEGRFVVRTACDPRSAFARAFPQSARERLMLEDPLTARHVEFETWAPQQAAALCADAVVLPGTIESFCFPLAEALGASVPVVAARSDFAREMCGRGALYADPSDPTEFAAAMRDAMHGRAPMPDPERQQRISWKRHVDGIAALCQRLASGGS